LHELKLLFSHEPHSLNYYLLAIFGGQKRITLPHCTLRARCIHPASTIITKRIPDKDTCEQNGDIMASSSGFIPTNCANQMLHGNIN